MSDVNPEQHLAPLPESLRLQLEKFKRHLWRIKITEAILAGFLGLIISFALVFALERMFAIPPLARLIILLAGISIFAVFAPLWINRWVFKHRKENQIARLISKQYPNLGDRLLGVVELQNQDENSKALSPELREAAMIAVAHDAKGRDLDGAVSSSWRNKLAFGTAIAALAAGVAFAIFPNAGRNAFKRWFMPLSDTERFVFTKVDRSKLPNPLYVAMDEPFSIPLTLQKDTESTPDFAEARFNSGSWKQYDYNKAQYLLKFNGKRTKGTVHYKLGDASHELEVRPIKRPKLGSIKGEIKFPAYLQRETLKEDFIAGQISVIEGSQLTIHANADRALNSAVVGPLIVEPYIAAISAEDAEIQETPEIDPENPPKPTKEKISHSVKGSTIIPETLTITKNTLRLPLTWTDKYGIAGLRSSELTITPSQDMSPTTYIQGIEKQKFIKFDETISFALHAGDDYGIKAAGISWVGSFSTPSPTPPAKGEEQFVAGDPYGTSSLETVELDFQQRGIPPQKLTIRTWVDDYNPATPRVYSEPIEVFLLSEAEYAEYIKKQLTEINNEFSEVLTEEKMNLTENKQIAKDLKNPEKAAEAKKKLEDQFIKEQENKQKLEEISKKMNKTLKEAMKSNSIDTKTLEKMSKAAQQMKEMAEKDMPDIAEKLDDAQSPKNSDEKTQEDVKEAIKKQEKLVEKMQKVAQKTEKAREDLEASTFVNRLKQAAKEESEIALALLGEDNLISGEHYSDLNIKRQLVMQAIYLKQKQTGADVRWIQEDLSFFFTRTENPIYKKIYDDIAASNIDDGLKYIEEEVAKSRVNEPMQHANYWQKKLYAWAKELDGVDKEDSDGGGDGNGGGDDSKEDKDFEFMVRMMKMIQIEQKIRGRTRALEQKRRNTLLGDATPAQPGLPKPAPTPVP